MDVVSHRIVFRTDASPAIGGGHVMRCLTLADGLAARGARCVFLTNPEAAAVVPALARSSHEIVQVAPGDDAVPARLAGGEGRPFAVVFDHYRLSAAAESAWRSTAARIVVIDDIAGRQHDCDLLIDPSHGRTRGDFEALVPPDAMTLTGTAYTLLRPEFADARPFALERRDGRPVERVLIATGLSDVGGLTARLAAWVAEAWPELAIDVVIGPSAVSRPGLEAMAARHSKLTLHVDPPFVAPLMTEADVAIGAIGTTTWERCALGLPSVALVLADNQRANAAALTETGAGLARPGTIDRGGLIADVADLIADAPRRIAMAKAAASLCDGLGVSRLTDAILKQPRSGDRTVRIRPAVLSDAARIWSWRNEAAARAMSLTTAPIAWSSHRGYYARMLAETARHRILIGESGGRPIGMVRFDRTETGPWRVSITLAPSARGLGIGRALLGEACTHFEKNGEAHLSLRAEIKSGNAASLAIFQANDFHPKAEDVDVQIFERTSALRSPPSENRH